MMDFLPILEEWYRSNCNGTWEHQNGIKIETLDNPGWSLEIDLESTGLQGRQFENIDYRRNESDWIACRVEGNKFVGFGGPKNLAEMIGVFISWQSA